MWHKKDEDVCHIFGEFQPLFNNRDIACVRNKENADVSQFDTEFIFYKNWEPVTRVGYDSSLKQSLPVELGTLEGEFLTVTKEQFAFSVDYNRADHLRKTQWRK